MNIAVNGDYFNSYIPQFLRERNNRVLTLGVDDEVSATLSIKGNVIATVRCMGGVGKADIVNMLKAKAREYHGMATVLIRNITREWSHEEGCYLKRENRVNRIGERPMFSISY